MKTNRVKHTLTTLSTFPYNIIIACIIALGIIWIIHVAYAVPFIYSIQRILSYIDEETTYLYVIDGEEIKKNAPWMLINTQKYHLSDWIYIRTNHVEFWFYPKNNQVYAINEPIQSVTNQLILPPVPLPIEYLNHASVYIYHRCDTCEDAQETIIVGNAGEYGVAHQFQTAREYITKNFLNPCFSITWNTELLKHSKMQYDTLKAEWNSDSMIHLEWDDLITNVLLYPNDMARYFSKNLDPIHLFPIYYSRLGQRMVQSREHACTYLKDHAWNSELGLQRFLYAHPQTNSIHPNKTGNNISAYSFLIDALSHCGEYDMVEEMKLAIKEAETSMGWIWQEGDIPTFLDNMWCAMLFNTGIQKDMGRKIKRYLPVCGGLGLIPPFFINAEHQHTYYLQMLPEYPTIIAFWKLTGDSHAEDFLWKYKRHRFSTRIRNPFWILWHQVDFLEQVVQDEQIRHLIHSGTSDIKKEKSSLRLEQQAWINAIQNALYLFVELDQHNSSSTGDALDYAYILRMLNETTEQTDRYQLAALSTILTEQQADGSWNARVPFHTPYAQSSSEKHHELKEYYRTDTNEYGFITYEDPLRLISTALILSQLQHYYYRDTFDETMYDKSKKQDISILQTNWNDTIQLFESICPVQFPEIPPPKKKPSQADPLTWGKSTMDESLKTAMEKMLWDHTHWASLVEERRLGFAMVNLKNTNQWAGVNIDVNQYAASYNKVQILLAAFEKENEEEAFHCSWHLNDLEPMIRISSNTSATAMSTLLGLEYINQVTEKYGLYIPNHGGLYIGKHYDSDTEDYFPFPLNPGLGSHIATPRMMARFWLMMDQGRLVSDEACQRMKAICYPPQISHKFVAGFAKAAIPARIYRKSGSWQGHHADGGIIEAEGLRYIVAILVQDPQGDALIQEMIIALHRILKQQT
jgi:beta-lactamase class A